MWYRWSAMSGDLYVGGDGELRKDRPMSSASNLYRIYLDNFDALERVSSRLAGEIKGTVKPQVEQLRQRYGRIGPAKASQEGGSTGHGSLWVRCKVPWLTGTWAMPCRNRKSWYNTAGWVLNSWCEGNPPSGSCKSCAGASCTLLCSADPCWAV